MPGMMNGPRIVVGTLELGSCVTGDALGGTTDEGMPPVEAPDSAGVAGAVGDTGDAGTPSVEPTLG